MQTSAPGVEPITERFELRPIRRLTGLMSVITGATALTGFVFWVQGSMVGAVGSWVMLISSLLGKLALKRHAPFTLVMTAYLTVGILVAAALGVLRGEDGLTSLFWLTVSPVVALNIGGRRAAWQVLFLTIAIESVALHAIRHRWVVPLFEHEGGVAPNLAALVGACVTMFLLVRSYDLENERTIRELIRRNQDLTEARREADLASRAKSDFLATMSHEIRTPLNGVLGMTAVLLGEPGSPKVIEGLQVIARSGDALLSVINDVLDFSKIESNQLELEEVSMNPGAQLRTVVELLTPRADAQNDVISLQISPDMPQWYLGDPTRVRQIMLNLLSNAVKFTHRGRVLLRLTYSDSRLTLTVADSGIGMSEEAQKRVFAPFVQADASTTRRFGGSGLGLVITRRLVDAMGGSIEMFSQEGQGSRFTVHLPLVPTEAPSRQQPMAERRCAPKRVLLVEDNHVNQMVAARLIEKLGHEIVVANDGDEALRAFEAFVFDVVLMDCHMPVLDGFDCTRELRRRGVIVPIIALTAAASVEDRQRCIDSGMNEVITKPLRPHVLLETLGNADAERTRTLAG